MPVMFPQAITSVWAVAENIAEKLSINPIEKISRKCIL
jgi:hypothetical protein